MDVVTFLFVGFLIASVVSIPWRSAFGERRVKSKSQSRAEAEEWLQNFEKEQGYRPYSPAELAQMDLEERYTHDKNAKSAAAWSPVWKETWIDSYGNVRDD